MEASITWNNLVYYNITNVKKITNAELGDLEKITKLCRKMDVVAEYLRFQFKKQIEIDGKCVGVLFKIAIFLL